MKESDLENEIQQKGLVAPRITPADVDNEIVGEDYYIFPNTTVTIALLTLRNGFTVTGESACASPENFDVEIGRKLAKDQARNKIWSFLGFALRQKLHEQSIE